MSNRAAFTIDGSASTPPGYVGTSAQSLQLQLEVLPATDVLRTQFEVGRKSSGAGALTFPGSGTAIEVAATPESVVNLTLPTVAGDDSVSYEVICRAVTAAGEFTYSRIVSIQNVLGLRKWIELEGEEFYVSGWYVDQNAIVDALATVVAGSISLDHGGLSGLADDDHVQYAPAAPAIVSLAGAANTLGLSHLRSFLRTTHGSANTLTVPANATTAFPVGSVLRGIQAGAGTTTIVAAGGVTINGTPLALPAQFSWFELKKVGTDEWDLHVDQSGLTIAGDVTGTLAASTVVKVRGKGLDTTVGTPSLGEFLVYDGTNWKNQKKATTTGIAANFTAGLELDNTSVASGGTPLNASPASKWTGHYWDGAADRTQSWLVQARRDAGGTIGEFTLYGDVGKGDGSLQAVGIRRTATLGELEVKPGSAGGRFEIGPSSTGPGYLEGADAPTIDATDQVLRLVGREQLWLRASGIDVFKSVDGRVEVFSDGGEPIILDSDSDIQFELGHANYATIKDLSGFMALIGSASLNGMLIAPDVPGVGVDGKILGLIGGAGGTGDTDGGDVFMQPGLASDAGVDGFAGIKDTAGDWRIWLDQEMELHYDAATAHDFQIAGDPSLLITPFGSYLALVGGASYDGIVVTVAAPGGATVGHNVAIIASAGGTDQAAGHSYFIPATATGTGADGSVGFRNLADDNWAFRYDSSKEAFFILNGTLGTPATPTGGVELWAASGALKARGSSGTITTLAPAEPHCQTCGLDFAHEWEHPGQGKKLSFCVWCATAPGAPLAGFVIERIERFDG